MQNNVIKNNGKAFFVEENGVLPFAFVLKKNDMMCQADR